MATVSMKVNIYETTIARVGTAIDGYIVDFWNQVDVNYTPSAMKISLVFDLVVQNAGGTEKSFRIAWEWFEDDDSPTAIETIIQNIVGNFETAMTAAEGNSSYTTVQYQKATLRLTITYS